MTKPIQLVFIDYFFLGTIIFVGGGFIYHVIRGLGN